MKKHHELVEVEGLLIHETHEEDENAGAFLIKALNGVEEWVPKSKCTKTKVESKRFMFIFEMPIALAEDKGFL